MPIFTKVSGTWRSEPSNLPPQVNVGGVWHQVNQGWTRVSGVWRQFFTFKDPPGSVTYSTPGVYSFTTPHGYTSLTVSAVAGGGGEGGDTFACSGRPGGGGGGSWMYNGIISISSTPFIITVTVGTGGINAGSGTCPCGCGCNGTNGGTTSLIWGLGNYTFGGGVGGDGDCNQLGGAGGTTSVVPANNGGAGGNGSFGHNGTPGVSYGSYYGGPWGIGDGGSGLVIISWS